MERTEKDIISFKDFMKEALFGKDGYYTKIEKLTNDFITPSNFSLPLSLCIKNFIDSLIFEFTTLPLEPSDPEIR